MSVVILSLKSTPTLMFEVLYSISMPIVVTRTKLGLISLPYQCPPLLRYNIYDPFYGNSSVLVRGLLLLLLFYGNGSVLVRGLLLLLLVYGNSSVLVRGLLLLLLVCGNGSVLVRGLLLLLFTA